MVFYHVLQCSIRSIRFTALNRLRFFIEISLLNAQFMPLIRVKSIVKTRFNNRFFKHWYTLQA